MSKLISSEYIANRARIPSLRPAWAKLKAYKPLTGRGDFLRLDANEGPPPPLAVLEGILARSARLITFYPECDGLREAAARAFGIEAGAVMPLNGADEGIRLLAQAFCAPGAPLLVSDPTFPMYRIYADLAEASVLSVPLDGTFQHDFARMRLAMAGAAMTVVVSPNNPTGLRSPAGELRLLLAAAEGRPLLLDETYADFCSQDFAPWLREFPNLIILRTLSKSHGVPGLRCGFILADPALIARLEPLRSPYNVSAVAAAVGAALLTEDTGWRERLAEAVRARTVLQGWLSEAKIPVYPSDAHFFMADLGTAKIDAIGFLRQNRILVRDLGGTAPGFVRISVTSSADARALADVLLPWWQSRERGGSR